MTAAQLVNRLLETGLDEPPEPPPDDWSAEGWRDEDDLANLASERGEDFAKHIFSGKFKKLGDVSHVPRSPADQAKWDAEQQERIIQKAAATFLRGQRTAKLRQAVPDLSWWAEFDETPPVFTGEMELMHGKLTGGRRDGEVINPALVAQVCIRYGIKLVGLLPANISRATVRDRMAALSTTVDLADAYAAKYQDQWMSAVEHDLDLTLATVDDDYVLDVSIPADDPNVLQKAVSASNIFKQVAAVFRKSWPGVKVVR